MTSPSNWKRDGGWSLVAFFGRAPGSPTQRRPQPGPYSFQSGMVSTDVLDTLEQGVPPNVVMVSIPEGRSRAEIAPP